MEHMGNHDQSKQGHGHNQENHYNIFDENSMNTIILIRLGETYSQAHTTKDTQSGCGKEKWINN